ncbi:MAG: polysaccharide biosynthesis tyrosine autokinase [Bacteroidales bacterium]|nr:polysaccharide biosynthesis tyrosine autokinase [Bacteroidales bacterium]
MVANNNIHEIYRSNKENSPTELMSGSLVHILWSGRWLILISVLIFLVIAFIYITKATPIYTSTSRVYVEQSGPKIIAEMEEGVMTRSKNYLYTQAELLKSTPIITAALSNTRIEQMQTFAQMDNIAAFLKHNLYVSVGKRDDIISISFNSPYPTEAAELVNTIVDSYITFHSKRKKSTSAEVLKILQNEKATQNKELSETLQALMDYRNENEGLIFEGRQGNLVIEKLETLSNALTEAQLTALEYKSMYESMKEMINNQDGIKQFVEAQRSTSVSSSIDTERAQLKAKLDELELNRRNLLRQLTTDHPGSIAYEKDIAEVKSQIADLEAGFANAQLTIAQQQYLAAKEKEEQISQYYEEQRQQAIALNEQLTKYTLLQSDYEQIKQYCETLDIRIRDLNVTEDTGALNINILEVANPSQKPSEPQKSRYMAIALILGLISGFGLAILRDWMDQKLHSAEEISNLLGIPVMGIVPSMSKRESISERGKKTELKPKSSWAEAYRTIRTAVFFSLPESEAKTIHVTSPAPGDGKTTLVSNLAIGMAQAGQHILILDADFRKPMQHNIFQVNHENIGLCSVLAERASTQEVIQHTGIDGLDLLTRGPEIPNPSEILNSKKFKELLKFLSEKYDRIIIDSPPVSPVTDAQILSAICDITLLVLRANKSTRKMSQQAQQSLMSVGARILGVVVNDVSKKSSYGYYNAYGNYNSYYGNDSDSQKGAMRKTAVIM